MSGKPMTARFAEWFRSTPAATTNNLEPLYDGPGTLTNQISAIALVVPRHTVVILLMCPDAHRPSPHTRRSPRPKTVPAGKIRLCVMGYQH